MTTQTKGKIDHLDEVVFKTRREMFRTALLNEKDYPAGHGRLSDGEGALCAGGVATEVAWGHGCPIQKEFVTYATLGAVPEDCSLPVSSIYGVSYNCEMHMMPVAVLKWYGYAENNKWLSFTDRQEWNHALWNGLMTMNDNGAPRAVMAAHVDDVR